MDEGYPWPVGDDGGVAGVLVGGRMNLLRVFPRRTKWTPVDDMAFVGDPPLLRPEADEVHISATFTWDQAAAVRLKEAWSQYYDTVKLGGPAFGDPGAEFVPGRYIRDGVTITSRGCPCRCPWCFVPAREGALRELPITDGWNVQDNNLLACSRDHIEAVFAMLRRQSQAAVFGGGWDTRLMKPWHGDLLKTIRVSAVWVACDTWGQLPLLERAKDVLGNLPVEKRRCYALMGFGGDTIDEAGRRLAAIYTAGFLPFAQLFRGEQPTIWSAEWRALARYWARPAAYRSHGRADD